MALVLAAPAVMCGAEGKIDRTTPSGGSEHRNRPSLVALAPPSAPGVALVAGVATGAAEARVEEVPEGEAARIDNIVKLTIQQLNNRYQGQKPVLRGVHAKDHGCVKAVFEVVPNLDPSLRVGVFSEPGRRYDAWIRFSNAATLVLDDDTKE